MTDFKSATSDGAWGGSGERAGAFGEEAGRELEPKKGAARGWRAPSWGGYLLLGGMAGVGAGTSGPGAAVGATVGLVRPRNGWTSNSTSLSLPLP